MAFTKAIQLSGGKRTGILNRQRALELYYKNPNHCGFCGSIIHVRENEAVSSIRIKKFCNHSCSASFTNRENPKRHPQGNCEYCGKPIPARRRFCSREHWNAGRLLQRKTKTREQKLKDAVRAVVSWRQRTKMKAVEYKGGKCTRCGYNRTIRALHFHHIDPSQKDFAISKASRSWKNIVKELDKCVLLCSNCHAEYHDGLFTLDPP